MAQRSFLRSLPVGALGAMLALFAAPAPAETTEQGAAGLELVIPGDAPVTYDRQVLATLPVREIITTTPWTEGTQVFRGVALAELVGTLDADAILVLTALNNYTVTMPASAVTADVPIIAFERNGAPMPVRNQGPYWLVYPFDDDPDYQTETVYSRSIWQLIRIEVSE